MKRNHNYIQITRECNQECVFCSNPRIKKEISISEFIQVARTIKEGGGCDVFLTGGEPTLHPNLIEIIQLCNKMNLNPRLITNGQMLANKEFALKLSEAKLDSINLSAYSHIEKIHNSITKKEDSYKNLLKAIDNLKSFKIPVTLNIVISSFNCQHLYDMVNFFLEYSLFDHFCFNYIDIMSGRAKGEEKLAPSYASFEIELHRVLRLLTMKNKTFRVERIPLCYLDSFESFSTETRKIVKKEIHNIKYINKQKIDSHFFKTNNSFKSCAVCSLKEICTGPYSKEIQNRNEVYPLFIDPIKIITAIKRDSVK
jgi:MoaA/NifB/PqqE/SkfB family radical SAM enzyme